MTVRTLCLATAASFTLTLGTAFAGPNGPQESTPAEKAQTQQLNNAQRNGSYVDPAIANGQATPANPVPAEAVSAAAANSQNDDANIQAQQTQQAIDQKRYERDLAASEADRDRYEHEMARYEWRKHHPYSWWRHRYESASLTAFYDLSRPALINVAVTDRTGFLIGHITDVVSTPDGRVARVRIDLGYGRAAWIEARNLRYYAGDRLLMIDLTPRQIWDRSTGI